MILIKNLIQQDGIRKSAEILSSVFTRIEPMFEPGVSTLDIDRVVEETIKAKGGQPAFLGYEGFPASVCTSVNEKVIHGIPDKTPLKEGDIVGCDIGVLLDRYYSDSAHTFVVGKTNREVQTLLMATKNSLNVAIEACVPGGRVKDIGKAVVKIIETHGYGIVTSYCGHGVGLSLHEDPQIPNYYPSAGPNPRFKPGMILAIEPMINTGRPDVEVLDDGWTVVTADGSLSAHFEHTILVTEKGQEILTSWEG